MFLACIVFLSSRVDVAFSTRASNYLFCFSSLVFPRNHSFNLTLVSRILSLRNIGLYLLVAFRSLQEVNLITEIAIISGNCRHDIFSGLRIFASVRYFSFAWESLLDQFSIYQNTN